MVEAVLKIYSFSCNIDEQKFDIFLFTFFIYTYNFRNIRQSLRQNLVNLLINQNPFSKLISVKLKSLQFCLDFRSKCYFFSSTVIFLNAIFRN